MINPSNLNLSTLPSVPLEARSRLPRSSGIYFAIDSLGTVQYIGLSKDIKQRWTQHHNCKRLNAIGGVKIAYLLVSDLKLLPTIESALIQWFMPPLNKGSRINPIPSTLTLGSIKVVRRIVIEAPGLGQRIKEAREADSRSLKTIAGAAGMTPMNWYRIESEEQELPEETLRKVEAALDINFGVSFND